eukprot:TRINITY_DN84986_c0_g1_i1.p1 TRINITY_DN84986_c0_g1~~TRINITY_DN84986_c0_g1_i1.p1  ORF type:complete len:296 (-),score=37.41 TRINITY_DN84986_c0_g1_i1:157-996(-)
MSAGGTSTRPTSAAVQLESRPGTGTATPQAVLGLNVDSVVSALMKSPLYAKIERMEHMLEKLTQQKVQEAPNAWGDSGKPNSATSGEPYQDAKDKQQECEGKLTTVLEQDMTPSQFVACEFSNYIAELVANKFADVPKVFVQLALELPHPATSNLSAFRNSFVYIPERTTLYIKNNRTQNIGELIMIVVHCLSHLKCGDMNVGANDSSHNFTAAFHQLLQFCCEELFFRRASNVQRSQGSSGTVSISHASIRELQSKMKGLDPSECSTFVRQHLGLDEE